MSGEEIKIECSNDVFKYTPDQTYDYIYELHQENQKLKKQLEVGEEQYNDLVEEKEELQEQLSIKTLQLEEIKLSKRDYTQENILEMKLTLKKNQQKEFIDYLEDEIKRINPKELNIGELNLRLNDIKFTQYLIYKEILQKYKEIIGDDK